MRRALATLLAPLSVFACATSTGPVSPSSGAPPAATVRPSASAATTSLGSSSASAVSSAASSDATLPATAYASAAPAATYPPPPTPAMGLAWQRVSPASGGLPTTSLRFSLLPDGRASYSDDDGKGPPRGDIVVEMRRMSFSCHGHLGSAQHKVLIDAARAALRTSCTTDASRRGMPSWSLAVDYGQTHVDCVVNPDTREYVAFEAALEDAKRAICAP